MATECDAEDTSDMHGLRGGDDLALNRIMGRHRDRVFRYLIRLLQDEEEALDLARHGVRHPRCREVVSTMLPPRR